MSDVRKVGRTQSPGGHGEPRSEVTITVNNRPVTMPEKHATGAEIKSAAGVPANFKLYDDKGHEIADDKRVNLKEGDRFTAISGQDVS